MPEIEEYRIKIEAIKERLKRSSGESDDEIRELNKRLGTVRDSLRRKQETIDSQNAEIAALREERAQLSDMLGQALAALETQGQGGIKEIVRSIDNEFAGLLGNDNKQPEQEGPGGDGGGDGGGGRREPATAETDSQEVESQDTPPEDLTWDPENESAPALKRILGRRKR